MKFITSKTININILFIVITISFICDVYSQKSNFIDFEKQFPIRFGTSNNVFVVKTANAIGMRSAKVDNQFIKYVKDAALEYGATKDFTWPMYKKIISVVSPNAIGIYKPMSEIEIKYSNGDTYYGEVINKSSSSSEFLKQGYGFYKTTRGESYQGFWHQDMKHGEGIYFDTIGNMYWGKWQNDHLIEDADCIIKYKNGNIFTGTLANGKKKYGFMIYKNNDIYYNAPKN